MTTTENIIALGKALRECNSCPVWGEEEIVKITRITGEDGNQRELILVKKLASNTSEYGVKNPDPSTFRCYAGTNRRTSTTPVGLANKLRKGFGIGQGIVTDGLKFRYVK